MYSRVQGAGGGVTLRSGRHRAEIADFGGLYHYPLPMATMAWAIARWKVASGQSSFLNSEYQIWYSGVLGRGGGGGDVTAGSPQRRNTWFWWSLALSTSNSHKGMNDSTLESWWWVELIFDSKENTSDLTPKYFSKYSDASGAGGSEVKTESLLSRSTLLWWI